MRLAVEKMDLDDIPQVLEVDRESYTIPWPANAYRREIAHNRNARYLTLRDVTDIGNDDSAERRKPGLPFFPWPLRTPGTRLERSRSLIGYAGMWIMVDEAHITTIAIRSAWRGRGFGELLLASLVDTARDTFAERVTLEVRVSNVTAQNLYRKYGFQEAGLRKRYYSDNNEDAYIMTTESIRDEAYRHRFDSLLAALRERIGRDSELSVAAPTLTPTER